MDAESGELVIIHEWVINTKSDTEYTAVQKQICSIEQEFNYLVKLNHVNLVRYLNIRHESTENKFIVQILQESVSGKFCALFAEKKIKFQLFYNFQMPFIVSSFVLFVLWLKFVDIFWFVTMF